MAFSCRRVTPSIDLLRRLARHLTGRYDRVCWHLPPNRLQLRWSSLKRIAVAETVVASVEPAKAATFTGAAWGSGKARMDNSQKGNSV